jgi:archaellum biogenesis ATPase FlaH
MPAFKRPDVPPGPLHDLMDALHELHLHAGYPSSRTLQSDIGRGVASHTAIHKAFTGHSVPSWGLIELLVEAMARRAKRQEAAEVERLRKLWANAARHRPDALPPSTGNPTAPERESGTAATGGFECRYIAELLPQVLDEIEAVGVGTAVGAFRIPTGLYDLDTLLGGWALGTLIVVGGRPSSGKTAVLLSFFRAASIKYKLPALFISAEMSTQELQTRILSAEARVASHTIRTGQMSEEDWNRLARTISAVADAPLMFGPSAASLKLKEIKTEAARLAEEQGLKLLVIDNFHTVLADEFLATQAEAILWQLKHLADELKIPIIVSVQADRPRKTYKNPTSMSDFESSIAIERVADVVIVVDRPGQDDREHPRFGELDLIVEKNRNGPVATATAEFQWFYARVIDMSTGPYPLFTVKAADNSSSDPKAS